VADALEEIEFPCSSCGSDLRYEPGKDSLTCEHCGTENALEKPDDGQGSGIDELDFQSALNAQLPEAQEAEVRTLSCDSCGARIEFDPDLHASECPFCASPVVTDTGPQRQIKPAALLPFVKSEKEARAAMTKWLGKLWFAPSGLQEYARKGRAMQGIYVPFWTYDADTKSHYRGQRGTYYYVTRSVQVEVDGKMQTEQREERKTRWHRVSGRVARAFDDVLVLGSKSLPRSHTDALAPWELGQLETYDPAYLAGFRAESYTVDLPEGYTEAVNVMNNRIEQDVLDDIGGDEQHVDHVDTDISDVTFKHILLPVWLAAYRFKNKSYQFVVNGQNGKVRGERPYSKGKIALTVLGGVIIIAALVFFLGGEG